MLHSAASDVSLHCLFSPICPNTHGKYGIYSLAETQLSLTDSDSVKITEIWKENNRK